MSQSPHSGGSAFLSSFWTDIVKDLNISPETFSYFMELYVCRTTSDKPGETEEQISDAKIRQSRRGNLKRELGETRMTIKVFLKGLQMLGVVKVQFQVDLVFQNGQVTRHTKAIQFVSDRPIDGLPSISSPRASVVLRKPPNVVLDIPKHYEQQD